MSIKLVAAAFHTEVGNGIRKLVLVKLAESAKDDGVCWPSYQHIADLCEIGRSTVRKHIKELQEMGLVRIENRKGPSGNRSNLYRINLPSCVSPGSTDGAPSSTTHVSPRVNSSPPDSIGGPPGSADGPPDSTTPRPPDSTRTCNLFEPVKEPVSEPIDSANAQEHTKASKRVRQDERFDEFWKAYPQKKGKMRALQTWKRKKLDRIADELIEDVQTRLAMDVQWQDKRYIPHGSTYLNQELWHDEVTTTSQVGNKSAGQERDGFAEWFERHNQQGGQDEVIDLTAKPNLDWLKGGKP